MTAGAPASPSSDPRGPDGGGRPATRPTPPVPAGDLASLLLADPERRAALEAVASLGLPDCWIGAGMVRAAAWDHLHDRPPARPDGDVDVVWFDPARADPAVDRALEAALRARAPGLDWSVRNQARMHARNGDAPYRSTTDAMRFWPETATAVAARWTGSGCELAAPFGPGDLLGLLLRPTPAFRGARHPVFLARIRDKGWLARWPRLRLVRDGEASRPVGDDPS